MSRSRRKTPACGAAVAETDKPFKVAEHRRERRATKAALGAGQDLPHPKAFGDPWDSEKDGKIYFGSRPRNEVFAKLMRK